MCSIGWSARRPVLADALLEIAHLGEVRTRLVVDRRLESVLAHHQDALGAQRELRVQPQVAQQVGHDRPVEALLQRSAGSGPPANRESCPELIDLEHVRVGVEARGRASPPTARSLLWKTRYSSGGSTTIDGEARRRGGHRHQMVERRMQHDREREARQERDREAGALSVPAMRAPSRRRSPSCRRA